MRYWSTEIVAEPILANSLALKLVKRSPMPQTAKLRMMKPSTTARIARPNRFRERLRISFSMAGGHSGQEVRERDL